MSAVASPASFAPTEPEEPIARAALPHWMYCPRQYALIHQEQAFAENVHTLRGQAVHKNIDTPGFEARSGYRVERALPVWNDAFGLIGKVRRRSRSYQGERVNSHRNSPHHHYGSAD